MFKKALDGDLSKLKDLGPAVQNTVSELIFGSQSKPSDNPIFLNTATLGPEMKKSMFTTELFSISAPLPCRWEIMKGLFRIILSS